MKNIAIILYVLAFLLFGYVAYDMSTGTGVSNQDLQAIAQANGVFRAALHDVQREEDINYLSIERKVKTSPDNEPKLLDAAKFARLTALQATFRSYNLFKDSTGAAPNSRVSLIADSLTTYEKFLNESFNGLSGMAIVQFEPPFPMKVHPSGVGLFLQDFQNSPRAIWETVGNHIAYTIFEAENLVGKAIYKQLPYGRPYFDTGKMFLITPSRTVGAGEEFKGEIFLGRDVFIPKLTTVPGRSDMNVKDHPDGGLLLEIPIDGTMTGSHGWEATIIAPYRNGYKVFRPSGEFQIR